MNLLTVWVEIQKFCQKFNHEPAEEYYFAAHDNKHKTF